MNRNRLLCLPGAALAALLAGAAPSASAQSAGDELNARISITALAADDGWDQPLRSPMALFVDPHAQEVFVADAGNNRVVVYDALLQPKYSFLHFVPDPASGRAVKGQPRDLVVNSRGEIILIDTHSECLDVLDFRGALLERLRLDLLLGDTALSPRPQAVALGPGDRTIVATAGDVAGVLILDQTFALERTIGVDDPAQSPFRTIMALTVDDSTLYVTDLYAEPAVKLFDLSGRYLRGFAGHDVDRADLSFPSGIAVMTDTAGEKTVWVTDGLRQVVKVYRPNGAFLAFVGGFGLKPGEFRYPGDIAFNGTAFYVLERAGGRVQRFVID
ncbi:MAG TPA: hypothetical protein PKW75_03185 [candidate division Zixibacteria bacterium]|nr:hypothetical protein [candidate division Zixibacteria bacterium]